MSFPRFLRFLMAFVASFFLYTGVSLANTTTENVDFDFGPDIYTVEFDKADFDTLSEYPPRDFRCQIIVIIVDLSDNYSRQQFGFWGTGRSWSDSRNSAFQRYGRHINTGGFWRSRYNHSFAFRNCHS